MATLRPELKMEWDNEKNVRSPEEYSCGSRAVVWWKCKKGHRWKAAISDRNRGNSCPKCAEERRVSFPEKAVLYYVEKVFTDVKANYKPEWLGLQELDIYIPEYKIAIEYDGIYGHSKLSGNKRDEKKNIICQERFLSHPDISAVTGIQTIENMFGICCTFPLIMLYYMYERKSNTL